MFCEKCGKEMPDNTQFCTYCGSVVGSQEISNQGVEQFVPKKKNKNFIVGIVSICVIIAIVCGAVFGVSKLFSKPYQKPFKECEKLYNKKDKDEVKYWQCFYPDVLSDYVEYRFDDYDYYTSLLDQLKEWGGKNYKLTITCGKAKKVSDKTLRKQQKKLREEYSKLYNQAISYGDADSDVLDSLKDASEIKIVAAYKIQGCTWSVQSPEKAVTGVKKSADIIDLDEDFYMYKTEDGDWFCQWNDWCDEWR